MPTRSVSTRKNFQERCMRKVLGCRTRAAARANFALYWFEALLDFLALLLPGMNTSPLTGPNKAQIRCHKLLATINLKRIILKPEKERSKSIPLHA